MPLTCRARGQTPGGPCTCTARRRGPWATCRPCRSFPSQRPAAWSGHPGVTGEVSGEKGGKGRLEGGWGGRRSGRPPGGGWAQHSESQMERCWATSAFPQALRFEKQQRKGCAGRNGSRLGKEDGGKKTEEGARDEGGKGGDERRDPSEAQQLRWQIVGGRSGLREDNGAGRNRTTGSRRSTSWK